jgi:hypothetical protein
MNVPAGPPLAAKKVEVENIVAVVSRTATHPLIWEMTRTWKVSPLNLVVKEVPDPE